MDVRPGSRLVLPAEDLAFVGRVSWQHVGEKDVDSANTFAIGSADLIDSKLSIAWGNAEVYAFGTNLPDDTDGLGGVSLGSGLEAAWPRRGRMISSVRGA